MKILVFGSTNLDHTYHLDHIARPKETMAADSYEVNAGGKGLNQAIALAKTGIKVYLASIVGRDGGFLLDTLKEYGVDTSYLKQEDIPNGHAIIQIDKNGENSIIINGGSNRCITPEYADSVLKDFSEGDYLVLQNEISSLEYIINKAHEKGMVILMNPSPCDESLKKLPLEKVSYLFINEVEGAFLSGHEKPQEILDALKNIYPATKVILTLGADGAMYRDDNECRRINSRKVKAVDTVGAGDTFQGYFTYGLAQGFSPRRCLELATAASSSTVTRHGAAKSIPTLAEVRELEKETRYPFPKTDLHFHLDGSIVPEVGYQIIQDPDVDLHVDSFEEYLKLTTVPATGVEVDVFEYLAKFATLVKLMQKPEHLEEIAYAAVRRAALQNLFYLEVRFAPQKHTQKGLSQKEAVEAVIRGMQKAEKDYPSIKTGLILCCMLDTEDNSKENEETVRLTEEFLGKGVVGIDLAGGEDSVPMKNYAYLFTDYHKKGYPMTIHAGDNGIPQNVSTVIDWGATRIGHGKHCYYDPEVTKKVIETNTTLEVCITSNIHCKTEPSYKEHPLKPLYDMGVKVSMSTDNMSISQIDLDFEYDRAKEEMGFTDNELIQMNINAIEASFMPDEEKPRFVAELRKYLK